MDAEVLERGQITEKLADLREEHEALDAAVSAMTITGVTDQLKMARLKKRKLMLKDRISWLEDQLSPDIIA